MHRQIYRQVLDCVRSLGPFRPARPRAQAAQDRRTPSRSCGALLALLLWSVFAVAATEALADSNGDRLTYLDETDPFYVGLNFPKLTTPQWVGEPGVDAVVILAIDDMRDPARYETVLRPVLERLKQIDGRAPVSIMTCKVDPQDPRLQGWLKEGLSLEVHTLTHPCPLLGKSNFVAAADVYNGCVELMNRVPGNRPVAFRMPCCDSMDSPSPRFYAEIFNGANGLGQFLTLDSSVMNITTSADSALPRDLAVDANGKAKFPKYLPFPAFVTTIENYPYPYVIGRLCWEFPPMVPSDWEAQHIEGTNSPVLLADWKADLDAAVLKQGTFTMIFHPYGWSSPEQLVALIDYAVGKYGNRVKFLSFREAAERLDRNLLAGQPLRAANGQDNGVRLVDVNNDGYLDVVIGNEQVRKTRVWHPQTRTWVETDFPAALVAVDAAGTQRETGVRFGVLSTDGAATVLVHNETTAGAWRFTGDRWTAEPWLLTGLELDGQPVLTTQGGRDRGVRLRDVNHDGLCELVVGNEAQNAVFAWLSDARVWKKLPYGLPSGAMIVDAAGRDAGLRFVDLNEDGFDDVVFSNDRSYSIHLFVGERFLGFPMGWSREVLTGKRGSFGEIPRIVRGGEHPNNGVWFHSRHLWAQNEDTDALKDHVDRRSYDELLVGLQPPSKSPEASLASIQVRPGFKVELVAHEPLVQDPIAFEWSPDGKLWVVEMGDYPLGIDNKGTPGGKVLFLEDTNGDGIYDRSTVFLDGLNFPNGVMPWGKGVLVSAAPEIFYAEDTNGDGKADVHRTLFRGFREGNQQHRANGYDYGLDNWLYGANGDSGGTVVSLLTGKSVNINGRDFRFRPDDGAFESEVGMTQYGRHRDDWGNWFGNDNPVWLWHFLMHERYLRRNPYLAVRATKKYLANYPDSTRVYPVSRMMQRFNDIDAAMHVTSGNSPTPYRDDLFGPDFATSVFASEPVHNAVHREVLEADGVTFTSHRAPGEQTNEFLASTDNWFRPTMMKTGPDGALYIADMYRLVIEHPEWIPADTLKHLDLRAGSDLGRIYRVYPSGAKLRKIPRLDNLSTSELVAALDSPNGWQRDTVQRLLVEAHNQSAVRPLEKLAASSARPKTRLQALCSLDGLHALTPKLVERALRDPHPAVREQAVRLSEQFMPAGDTRPSRATERLTATLLKLVDDPSIRVRYQLAFSLGEWNDPRAGLALVRLAEKDLQDENVQTAVMSSAVPHVGPMLDAVLRAPGASPPAGLLDSLFGLATALGNTSALANGLGQISQPRGGGYAAWQFAALSGFLDALDRRGQSLARFETSADPALKRAIGQSAALFAQARVAALEAKAPAADRVAAIRLLGRGVSDQAKDLEGLGGLLGPQNPPQWQQAALATLARAQGGQVAEILLSGWSSYGPVLRLQVVNVLLTRQAWVPVLLAALEAGKIPPGQISTPHQQKLLASADPAVRERATKLFSATRPDRQKVLAEYQGVADLTGDPARGAPLFKQNCELCHRLRNEGNEIGPDLGGLAEKSIQVLLVAILDPNQSVEARYLSYTAVTKTDQEYSGVIAAETPNSITLKLAGGAEQVILRNDLKELTGSGLSLMPEGFEKTLKPQDLADIIAYIKASPRPAQ